MNIFKQVMIIFKPAMNIFNSKALPIKGVARFVEQPRQCQGMPGSVAAYAGKGFVVPHWGGLCRGRSFNDNMVNECLQSMHPLLS